MDTRERFVRTLTGKPVDLPLDGNAYEARLKQLAAKSRFKKTVTGKGPKDMTASFR